MSTTSNIASDAVESAVGSVDVCVVIDTCDAPITIYSLARPDDHTVAVGCQCPQTRDSGSQRSFPLAFLVLTPAPHGLAAHWMVRTTTLHGRYTGDADTRTGVTTASYGNVFGCRADTPHLSLRLPAADQPPEHPSDSQCQRIYRTAHTTLSYHMTQFKHTIQ